MFSSEFFFAYGSTPTQIPVLTLHFAFPIFASSLSLFYPCLWNILEADSSFSFNTYYPLHRILWYRFNFSFILRFNSLRCPAFQQHFNTFIDTSDSLTPFCVKPTIQTINNFSATHAHSRFNAHFLSNPDFNSFPDVAVLREAPLPVEPLLRPIVLSLDTSFWKPPLYAFICSSLSQHALFQTNFENGEILVFILDSFKSGRLFHSFPLLFIRYLAYKKKKKKKGVVCGRLFQFVRSCSHLIRVLFRSISFQVRLSALPQSLRLCFFLKSFCLRRKFELQIGRQLCLSPISSDP